MWLLIYWEVTFNTHYLVYLLAERTLIACYHLLIWHLLVSRHSVDTQTFERILHLYIDSVASRQSSTSSLITLIYRQSSDSHKDISTRHLSAEYFDHRLTSLGELLALLDSILDTTSTNNSLIVDHLACFTLLLHLFLVEGNTLVYLWYNLDSLRLNAYKLTFALIHRFITVWPLLHHSRDYSPLQDLSLTYSCDLVLYCYLDQLLVVLDIISAPSHCWHYHCSHLSVSS